MQNTIFIQIASYRDPELIPTIKDCISQAAYPERLSFGIVWQHASEDEWDSLDEFKHLNNFRIIDVDYKEAKGVCWARSLAQTLYNGERYCLQLDSHHRFTKNWDVTLVRMLQELQKNGHEKPLLTAYLTSYNPELEQSLSEIEKIKSRNIHPWKLNFDRFAPDGVVHFTPGDIPNYTAFNAPIPSRFLSAHFIFTLGQFCKEVPYDPEYYFHGEEISLAVRAYTHGYDLFHPHRVIIWHEYMRDKKVKHWSDSKDWESIDKNAKDKNRKLLGVECEVQHIEKYGLGTVRTLRQYEMYAGIEFKTKRIHIHTKEENLLPIPVESEEEFCSKLLNYKKYCIDVFREEFEEDDYDFWVVAFKDEFKNEIYREDVPDVSIPHILNLNPQNKFIQIWRNFYADVDAKYWLVWPHSKSKGWCKIIEGTL